MAGKGFGQRASQGTPLPDMQESDTVIWRCWQILTPRFHFAGEFSEFEAYFRSQPHTERVYGKGDLLWKPGQPYDRVNYYVSGASVCYALHETGRRRLFCFQGPGTMLPGFHTNDFRIELSLVIEALCEVRVLEFSVEVFRAMFASRSDLAKCVVNSYAKIVNRFLFESLHQEFNSSRVKLCYLLYLLTMHQPANSGLVIEMTQEDIADILGMSRVQITRELTWLRGQGILATTRGRITISDLPALAALCTDEARIS